MSLPEIRIKDAWLLRGATSVYLNELWGNGEPLRSDVEYSQIVEKYKKAWQPLEEKILTGMQSALGLKFRQQIIDVYIAPWFSAFSDPMVIGVTQKPDQFVDTLTHEIIHRLLTDNTSVPYETLQTPTWQKLFGKDHSWNCLIHIPVHAVLKHIYLDVLNEPSRLQRDIDYVKRGEDADYIDAWEYVNTNDYNGIIDKLKKSYKNT